MDVPANLANKYLVVYPSNLSVARLQPHFLFPAFSPHTVSSLLSSLLLTLQKYFLVSTLLYTTRLHISNLEDGKAHALS